MSEPGGDNGKMNRMNTMHDRWTERLSEYLDGEMSWDDQAKLEAHLDQCVECSATLADLRRVVARADGLEDQPPTRGSTGTRNQTRRDRPMEG